MLEYIKVSSEHNDTSIVIMMGTNIIFCASTTKSKIAHLFDKKRKCTPTNFFTMRLQVNNFTTRLNHMFTGHFKKNFSNNNT